MDTKALDSYLSQSDEDAHPEWFADDQDPYRVYAIEFFIDPDPAENNQDDRSQVASEFNFGFDGEQIEEEGS